MTTYCRHRRTRPLLHALFTIALVLIALGYGLMAGVARGHADAIQTQSTHRSV